MDVFHTVAGDDGSPALVLSGSLGSDLSMWEPQMDELARRFRVIRYDHRGHGASVAEPGPYEQSDLGGDVIEMLDRLGIERTHFCGISLGGMVGMWLAIHASERIDRLVLCCTSAALDAADAWNERAATVREQGMGTVAVAVVSRWFTTEYAVAHPDPVRTMQEMVLATDPEGYAGCCEAIATMDLRSDLGRLAAPTLAIAGAQDPAIPLEHSHAIAARVQGCRVEVVEGAAHLASYEQAEAVTSLIVEHLSDQNG